MIRVRLYWFGLVALLGFSHLRYRQDFYNARILFSEGHTMGGGEGSVSIMYIMQPFHNLLSLSFVQSHVL